MRKNNIFIIYTYVIYLSVYMYIYIYIYIYTHTHTHTEINFVCFYLHVTTYISENNVATS